MGVTIPKLLACFLIVCFAVSSNAQQSTSLSKQVLAVRKKVESLPPQAHISVIRIGAPEEFGNFISSNQEGFTFYDVDQKSDITLKYEQVRKVKEGYGGYNSIRGRHTDSTKQLIVLIAVAGALGALIGAVAAEK